MLTKEDIATAKEIAKVLRESEVDELTVAGQLITVLLAKREQQRTWVGLTELEMAEFVKTMERGNFLVAIYDIEKKLKEKNT